MGFLWFFWQKLRPTHLSQIALACYSYLLLFFRHRHVKINTQHTTKKNTSVLCGLSTLVNGAKRRRSQRASRALCCPYRMAACTCKWVLIGCGFAIRIGFGSDPFLSQPEHEAATVSSTSSSICLTPAAATAAAAAAAAVGWCSPLNKRPQKTGESKKPTITNRINSTINTPKHPPNHRDATETEREHIICGDGVVLHADSIFSLDYTYIYI